MRTNYSDKFTEEQVNLIKEDYLSGLSIRNIMNKYDIKSNQFVQNILKGLTRSYSEANKLSHKLHPEWFKQNDKSKEKIRQARLKFMKEHLEQTAWRKRNTPSYPELCFINYLHDRELDKKYYIEREKSFFPYFADFAFELLKLVVEIDGSQHLEKSRKEADVKKNNIILQSGWSVVRITENLVKTDWSAIDTIFKEIENGKVFTNENNKFGIFTYSSKRLKLPRLENGLTQKQIELHFKQRRTEWPSKEKLFSLIIEYPFRTIGKMYGVSDKAISKWCKYYKIPSTKRELKEYLGN